MMESFLTEDDKDLITDLLVRYEDVLDDTGKELSAKELCSECPHLVAEVQTRIESLRTTAWTKKDPGRPLTDNRNSEPTDYSGTVLSERYRLDELVGSGGYGSVYRAEDLKLKRTVAVKIGHHRTSSDLLLDEARRVAKLSHPNIVSVHDCGSHDGHHFLVFEFVEGENLAQLIRSKKLTIREKIELVATVAEALSSAHQLVLVHRDIKPENLIVNTDGKVLVADFGVACSLRDVALGRAKTSGTLPYQSPEVLSNELQLLDGRSDIHSLGVVLFELLCGKSPFPAKDKAELREQILFRQPVALRDVDSTLPIELDDICSRAMAKHPGDRFKTVDEFAEALRSWLELPRKRNWLRSGIFGLVGLVGVFAVWFALSRTHKGLVQDGVLHFDGRTRIVTTVQRTMPVTVEAWIKPDPYDGEASQFAVGSDVPGKYGLGIALCGSMLGAEYVEGMLNTSIPVPPNHWSHVAAIFTESDTKLFLNGKLIGTAPGSIARSGETNFVIGNVGESNLIDFYKGEMKSVRISSGVRYADESFEIGELQIDETTLLLIVGTITQVDDSFLVGDEIIGTVERF